MHDDAMERLFGYEPMWEGLLTYMYYPIGISHPEDTPPLLSSSVRVCGHEGYLQRCCETLIIIQQYVET